MPQNYIATSDGSIYEDEFSLTLGRPMPDPWDEKDQYKKQEDTAKEEPNRNIVLPITEYNDPNPTVSSDPFEVAAARQKASVKPTEGRTEGLTTKVLEKLPGYPAYVVDNMLSLPERAIQGGIAAATLGERGADVGPAVETALGMMGARTPFIKPGELGVFGGVTAKTSNQKALNEAMLLEGSGEHPISIYQRTGWYRGHEGGWKFEIPDQGAKVIDYGPKDTIPQTLSDLLDHPKLYEAYPELKNMDIVISKSKDYVGSVTWNASKKKRVIELNEKYFNTTNKDLLAELKTTLLHELQHLIQTRERFSKGASYVTEKDFKHKWFNDVQDHLFSVEKIIEDKRIELGREPSVHDFSEKTQAYIRKVDRLYKIHEEMRKVAPEVAQENYFKTAGEVEARNVERRSENPEEYNKLVPPSKTEIMPLQKQIISNKVIFYEPYGPEGQGR